MCCGWSEAADAFDVHPPESGPCQGRRRGASEPKAKAAFDCGASGSKAETLIVSDVGRGYRSLPWRAISSVTLAALIGLPK